MKQNVETIIFNVLSNYPNSNWEELYLELFKNAYKAGNADLAVQAFYKIAIEATRTKNDWAIKELLSNDDLILTMKKLNLYSLAKDLIKTIPQEKTKRIKDKYFDQILSFERSNLKFQFREGNQHRLCACCHNFVLTCEEIQNFPLINEDKYIREKFRTAMTQPQYHKRVFIIDYLLDELAKRNPDFSLYFELWLTAEYAGIHLSPNRFIDLIGDQILKKYYFNSFLSIINLRHPEHDNFIDDVIELLLRNKKYQMAYYLNTKISSPYLRLFYTVGSMLNTDGTYTRDDKSRITFLEKVLASIRHEKVDNE